MPVNPCAQLLVLVPSSGNIAVPERELEDFKAREIKQPRVRFRIEEAKRIKLGDLLLGKLLQALFLGQNPSCQFGVILPKFVNPDMTMLLLELPQKEVHSVPIRGAVDFHSSA